MDLDKSFDKLRKIVVTNVKTLKNTLSDIGIKGQQMLKYYNEKNPMKRYVYGKNVGIVMEWISTGDGNGLDPGLKSIPKWSVECDDDEYIKDYTIIKGIGTNGGLDTPEIVFTPVATCMKKKFSTPTFKHYRPNPFKIPLRVENDLDQTQVMIMSINTKRYLITNGIDDAKTKFSTIPERFYIKNLGVSAQVSTSMLEAFRLVSMRRIGKEIDIEKDIIIFLSFDMFGICSIYTPKLEMKNGETLNDYLYRVIGKYGVERMSDVVISDVVETFDVSTNVMPEEKFIILYEI